MLLRVWAYPWGPEELSDQNNDDFFNEPIIEEREYEESEVENIKDGSSPWFLYIISVLGLILEAIAVNYVIYSRDFLFEVYKNFNTNKLKFQEVIEVAIILFSGVYSFTIGLLSIVIFFLFSNSNKS